jgi:hypothetical protein
VKPSLNTEMTRAFLQATCQKRIVICLMFDKNGGVVSVESNRCSPPNGVCPRLDLVTTKENYPPNRCNTEHAEVRALKLAKRMPTHAVLIGHKFFCDDCERLLKSYGIGMEVMS